MTREEGGSSESLIDRFAADKRTTATISNTKDLDCSKALQQRQGQKDRAEENITERPTSQGNDGHECLGLSTPTTTTDKPSNETICPRFLFSSARPCQGSCQPDSVRFSTLGLGWQSCSPPSPPPFYSYRRARSFRRCSWRITRSLVGLTGLRCCSGVELLGLIQAGEFKRRFAAFLHSYPFTLRPRLDLEVLFGRLSVFRF